MFVFSLSGVYLLDFFYSGVQFLFTVESSSLLCLLVVSWFVCFGDDALIS